MPVLVYGALALLLCVQSGLNFADNVNDAKDASDRYDPQFALVNTLPEKKMVEQTDDILTLAFDHNAFEDSEWLALLHYHPTLFGYKSAADDARFFLANDGRKNPKEELSANIKAFLAKQNLIGNTETRVTQEHHAQCRFPARFNWLLRQEWAEDTVFPRVVCEQFDRWREQFSPDALTLIFPSAYINSPSSMFGHTFLRVDPYDFNTSNRLNSMAVDYAAQTTGQESQGSLIFRGLITGFRGGVTVMPYHLKVRQYNDLESRDIWEYALNFSPEETRQFVRHIWEVGFVNFDYYYITENCSYRILAYLEAVRPSGLLDGFRFQVIPANTIQVLEDKDFIAQADYRPSVASQLDSYIRHLDQDEKSWLRRLVYEDNTLEEFDESQLEIGQKSVLLETAYEAIRYQKTIDKISKTEASKRSFPLLKARSEIKTNTQLPVPVKPKVHGAGGHATARLDLGAGVTSLQGTHEEYVDLGIRPVYHSLTDPQQGFSFGAQIEFLNTRLRFFEERLQLEQLSLLEIYSLAPKRIYDFPLSWRVGAGVKRVYFNDEDELPAYLELGFGKALHTRKGLFFALLDGEVQLDNDFYEGVGLLPGLQLGWLNATENTQQLFRLELKNAIDQVLDESAGATFTHTWNLKKDNALSIELSRNKFADFYHSTASLNYRLFF